METSKGTQGRDLRYKDEEWLENQYIDKEKSQIIIAEECGTSRHVISYWMKKFKIPTRKKHLKKTKFLMSKIKKEGYKNGDLIPWNKNKKLSEDHKKKLSITHKGKETWSKGKSFSDEHKKNISISHKGIHLGKKHPNWKGGKYKISKGYILIYGSNHPYCDPHRYVREHRLVMEKHLGRYLTTEEVVHHINEIKDDNRIENLCLCKNNSHHSRIQHQLKKVALELYRSKKFGRLDFDKNIGEYYIIFENKKDIAS